eukprot:TRINITY_DN32640_c0_g1_i1.p1 TRINITY_DN32640_c0_g1~~TRINITY_DN32640_c0_g1_i1.p1  ORF type:complete len:744 (-),score=100.13 TRINITY_DN32640_c0_g1_i1:64-2295(-)
MFLKVPEEAKSEGTWDTVCADKSFVVERHKNKRSKKTADSTVENPFRIRQNTGKKLVVAVAREYKQILADWESLTSEIDKHGSLAMSASGDRQWSTLIAPLVNNSMASSPIAVQQPNKTPSQDSGEGGEVVAAQPGSLTIEAVPEDESTPSTSATPPIAVDENRLSTSSVPEISTATLPVVEDSSSVPTTPITPAAVPPSIPVVPRAASASSSTPDASEAVVVYSNVIQALSTICLILNTVTDPVPFLHQLCVVLVLVYCCWYESAIDFVLLFIAAWLFSRRCTVITSHMDQQVVLRIAAHWTTAFSKGVAFVYDVLTWKVPAITRKVVVGLVGVVAVRLLFRFLLPADVQFKIYSMAFAIAAGYAVLFSGPLMPPHLFTMSPTSTTSSQMQPTSAPHTPLLLDESPRGFAPQQHSLPPQFQQQPPPAAAAAQPQPAKRQKPARPKPAPAVETPPPPQPVAETTSPAQGAGEAETVVAPTTTTTTTSAAPEQNEKPEKTTTSSSSSSSTRKAPFHSGLQLTDKEIELVSKYSHLTKGLQVLDTPGWKVSAKKNGVLFESLEVDWAPTKAVRFSATCTGSIQGFYEVINDKVKMEKVDDLMQGAEYFDVGDEHSELAYTYYKSPIFGVTKRDMCTIVTSLLLESSGIGLQGGESVVDPRVPEKKGYVRGHVHRYIWMGQVIPDQPGKLRICLFFCIDPKGWLPAKAVDATNNLQIPKVVMVKDMVMAESQRLAAGGASNLKSRA